LDLFFDHSLLHRRALLILSPSSFIAAMIADASSPFFFSNSPTFWLSAVSLAFQDFYFGNDLFFFLHLKSIMVSMTVTSSPLRFQSSSILLRVVPNLFKIMHLRCPPYKVHVISLYNGKSFCKFLETIDLAFFEILLH